MNLEGVLEVLLFLQGDEGITLEKICQILEINEAEAKKHLLNLKKNYESDNRGLRIRYLGNAFKLSTKEEYRAYYQKLLTNEESSTLSPAALEVLAIIAYNEPITRAEIDEMRGLASDYTLRKLVAKGLVKETGKSTMPGRPNLYATTHEFLDYFGLATKEDLPKFEVEEAKSEAKELFTSIYKDENEKVLEKN